MKWLNVKNKIKRAEQNLMRNEKSEWSWKIIAYMTKTSYHQGQGSRPAVSADELFLARLTFLGSNLASNSYANTTRWTRPKRNQGLGPLLYMFQYNTRLSIHKVAYIITVIYLLTTILHNQFSLKAVKTTMKATMMALVAYKSSFPSLLVDSSYFPICYPCDILKE